MATATSSAGAPVARDQDHEAEQRHLAGTAWASVEQVGEVGGQRDQGRIGEEPPEGVGAVTENAMTRHRSPSEQLHRPGRQPPGGEGPEMTGEAAGLTVAGQVVEEAEQAEPDGHDRHHPSRLVGHTIELQIEALAQQEHRLGPDGHEDQQHADGSGQLDATMVRAHQRRPVEDPEGQPLQQPGRHGPGDEPDETVH